MSMSTYWQIVVVVAVVVVVVVEVAAAAAAMGHLYSALLWDEPTARDAQIWPMIAWGSQSFTCHPLTNYTCLYSPAAGHHCPLSVTRCAYPRRDGQAELTWVADVYNCMSSAYWWHATLKWNVLETIRVVKMQNKRGIIKDPCGTLYSDSLLLQHYWLC